MEVRRIRVMTAASTTGRSADARARSMASACASSRTGTRKWRARFQPWEMLAGEETG